MNVTVLVACTGSVASVKVPILIETILKRANSVKVFLAPTKNSQQFFDLPALVRGNPRVEHVGLEDIAETHQDRFLELARDVKLVLIAPLGANTMAKICNGITDDFLTYFLKNYLNKHTSEITTIVCLAMNIAMWNHPITNEHIQKLKSMRYLIVPPICKKLASGDIGFGAMAEVDDIVNTLLKHLT